MALKKRVTIEIHPTCGPCRRSPNFPGEIPAGSAKRIRSITRFAERYPHVRFLLSLELEDQLTSSQASQVHAHISSIWPFETVRNSIRPVSVSRTDLTELHGVGAQCPAGGGTIADLDGDDLSYAGWRSYLARNRHCDFVRLWRSEWQGIPGGKFVPIHRRRFVIPRRDIFEVRRLIQGTP